MKTFGYIALVLIVIATTGCDIALDLTDANW